MTAATAAAPCPRRWRRWRWRVGGTTVLLVILVVFHAPLFRLLAGGLVVNEPLETTDAVVVMGASGPFQATPFGEAAALYKEGMAHEIVLIEDRSSRLVRMGILPILEVEGRRELAAEGVPGEALTVLPGEYLTDWDGPRRLGGWLEEHPGATVTVLCDEFDSRRMRGICREVLGSDVAGRVHWRALPDRRFGVANWWRSRQGIVQFAGAYVSLAHARVFGEPPQPTEKWDPDVYEGRLREAGR